MPVDSTSSCYLFQGLVAAFLLPKCGEFSISNMDKEEESYRMKCLFDEMNELYTHQAAVIFVISILLM